MQFFTPVKLLCFLGFHDWIYGYDSSTKKYIKKCSRCNKNTTVDINEAKNKIPELVKMQKKFNK